MPYLRLIRTRAEAFNGIKNYASYFEPNKFAALAPAQQADMNQTIARGHAFFGICCGGVYYFANAKYAASRAPGDVVRGLTPEEYSFHRNNSEMSINAGGGTKVMAAYFGKPVAPDHPAYAHLHAFAMRQGVDLGRHSSRVLYFLDLDAEAAAPQPPPVAASQPTGCAVPRVVPPTVPAAAVPASSTVAVDEAQLIQAVVGLAGRLSPTGLATLKEQVKAL